MPQKHARRSAGAAAPKNDHEEYLAKFRELFRSPKVQSLFSFQLFLCALRKHAENENDPLVGELLKLALSERAAGR